MTLACQQCADHPANVRLVIDNEDSCHAVSGAWRFTVRTGCGGGGLSGGKRAATSSFAQKLGREPLTLGDSLYFDGDCINCLLDSLESARNLGWNLWSLRFVFDSLRVGFDHRPADYDRRHHREKAERDKKSNHLWSHQSALLEDA
jgi:hypothetical protein